MNFKTQITAVSMSCSIEVLTRFSVFAIHIYNKIRLLPIFSTQMPLFDTQTEMEPFHATTD